MREINPLVSIIVRTKDRPKLLKQALQSIADQSWRPIEVVLVNDGGCDLDIAEIKGILDDISLNYIRLVENTGRAHAGNEGINNAKGQYVGFLDDDDELLPEHVSSLSSLLGQTDYVIAYADTEMVFRKYHIEKKEFVESEKRLFASRTFSFNDILMENYIPLISILFAKTALDAIGGFDENFDLYEDWDLLIRCGHVYPFYHMSGVTSKYFQWSKDLQIAHSQDNWEMVEQAYKRVVTKHQDKYTADVIRYYRDTLRKRDYTIAEKEGRISDLERSITELGSALQAKEVHIQQVCSGRGWKLLSGYYYIRDGLSKLLR